MSQLVIMRINDLDPNSNFKLRSDLHIARKIWHITAVLAVTYLYIILERRTALLSLALAMIFFIGMDILRLRSGALNSAAIKIFGKVMRQSEVDSPAGTTYLLSGVFISVFLFPKDVVTLTLLFLAIADPAASYFGIRWGKDKIINNKSLQGTLAAFVICFVLALVYFYKRGLLLERILLASLLAGISGALSELIPIKKLDDNLTFPVLCSFLLWIMFNIFS